MPQAISRYPNFNIKSVSSPSNHGFPGCLYECVWGGTRIVQKSTEEVEKIARQLVDRAREVGLFVDVKL